MVVFGTRPEVIKLAPVVSAVQHCGDLSLSIVSTNQHTTMLQQMLDVLAIKPDYELGLMEANQSLSLITERVLRGLETIIQAERPHAMLVQGDTTSAFAAALAAFYARVWIGHVEAGLRTGDPASPFPEEMNRRLVGALVNHHFAPTERARHALLGEGVSDGMITITGNTIVDALEMVRERASRTVARFSVASGDGGRLVVVTAHRRESFGAPLRRVCEAVRRIVENVPDVQVVFPVHLNPSVRAPVHSLLGGVSRVHLIEPVDYLMMIGLLMRADLVLTDSGGIQEEAAALGRPTLVLRDKTERTEGVEAGVARLVGTDADRIVREAIGLLTDEAAHAAMAQASDCYGDGRAADRIVAVLRQPLVA